MDSIINAFANAGLALDYFSDCDLYQYDGYDHGNNILVQFNTGINGNNKPAIFGEYRSNSDQSYSITGTIEEWVDEFSKYLPYMAKGEDFDW